MTWVGLATWPGWDLLHDLGNLLPALGGCLLHDLGGCLLHDLGVLATWPGWMLATWPGWVLDTWPGWVLATDLGGCLLHDLGGCLLYDLGGCLLYDLGGCLLQTWVGACYKTWVGLATWPGWVLATWPCWVVMVFYTPHRPPPLSHYIAYIQSLLWSYNYSKLLVKIKLIFIFWHITTNTVYCIRASARVGTRQYPGFRRGWIELGGNDKTGLLWFTIEF